MNEMREGGMDGGREPPSIPPSLRREGGVSPA